jgi:hypothetical protein
MRNWREIRKAPSTFSDHTVAYVKGYILALEDVLADIDNAGPEGEPEYLMGIESVEGWVRQSLAEARETLEMVNKAKGNRQ